MNLTCEAGAKSFFIEPMRAVLNANEVSEAHCIVTSWSGDSEIASPLVPFNRTRILKGIGIQAADRFKRHTKLQANKSHLVRFAMHRSDYAISLS